MDFLDTQLGELPIAILDFETTGLSPRVGARVVEVAIVRVEPGQDPVVVLDTLVDPQGPVLCTRIHGIADEDVEGAPQFSEIADDLVRSAAGAVFGAFNASFDMAFYSAEMATFRRGTSLRLPPHLCMMWLRPLIGAGPRCTLSAACQAIGMTATSHRAAEDALATGYLWRHYVDVARARGIHTVRDLRAAGSHAYLESLAWPAYSDEDVFAIGREPSSTALKPRLDSIQDPRTTSRSPNAQQQTAPSAQTLPIDHAAGVRSYWNALISAFVDRVVTPEEISALLNEQALSGIDTPSIRALHARFFADRLTEAAEDNTVRFSEAVELVQLHAALRALGWAPGDP